eukprot:TRINITY_DN17382_c1_g1_i1.p1 TRINITY_DN17382_c1_g1~~TRINITY_DN17382_c1_g1_i1.p1  ORF type:complete len:103 (+),score=23.15 TRINITY_DN17382_c1_g1_i1:93-401(+)
MHHHPTALLYLLQRGLNPNIGFRAFSGYNGKTAEKIAHMEEARDIMNLFEQWRNWKTSWPKSHHKFSIQRQLNIEEIVLLLHTHSIPRELVILTILHYLKLT